ncbi:hypothetical protein V1224_06755 [Lachnospiraceae bacterium JLR.KK008]
MRYGMGGRGYTGVCPRLCAEGEPQAGYGRRLASTKTEKERGNDPWQRE